MPEVVINTPEGEAALVADNNATLEAKAKEIDDKAKAPSADPAPKFAGKYATAEELEKAYKELEQKLGQKATTTDAAKTPTTVDDLKINDAEAAVKAAGLDMDKLTQEYRSNKALSPETYASFEKAGISKDTVNQYIAGQEALAREFTQEAVTAAGGAEGYTSLVQWAAQNLSEQEKLTYNNLINTGDIETVKLAISGLKAKMETAEGREPDLLKGRNPASMAFKSDEEAREAMKDPRYRKDPAYNAEVRKRIEAML